MSTEHKSIFISEEVGAGQTVAETYVPASGVQEALITEFRGEAAFTPNSVVKVVWCWNHASDPEQILWSTKGSVHIDTLDRAITGCDGVRKLAIVLENGEDGDIVMSGSCQFREIT